MIYAIAALTMISGAFIVQMGITIRNLYLNSFTLTRWEWKLFETTNVLAWFILPIAIIAASIAWRGVMKAKRHPAQFGGLRLAGFCLTLSLLLVVVDGTVFLTGIPSMLERGRIKKQAYTEAMMYKLNNAIAKYRDQYGTYPPHLIDLQEMDPDMQTVLDYWEHTFIYTAITPDVASRVTPVPFQNYELVSRGRDGLLGTADDIVMRDGSILSGPQTKDEPKPSTDPSRP